jgi:N utilization substance protein B
MLTEISDHAYKTAEDAKQKMLPSQEDLDPNTKFIDNQFLKHLSKNAELFRKAGARKISWQNEPELVKRLYNNIRSSKEFEAYMENSNTSYQEDKEFVITAFKKHIMTDELLIHYFDEHSIYWVDDFDLVYSMIIKTIKGFTEESNENTSLLPLFKDEEDDRQFALELFRKTIYNDHDYSKLIADKTDNWEVERIAMMDVLLMKMAIAEALNFSNIPVKVTLNEYIEISKNYSTPKSKQFINGILDKLIIDFKKNDLLRKVGRGLMD